MLVLIVENEIYLAQSISAKLSEIGYQCDIAATTNEALNDKRYDVVLLSTNVAGQDFYPVIERYKKSIIIMLINYVSSDTVTAPIKAGANDYILKPFMMDELLRKIDHFREFERLSSESRSYRDYLNHVFRDCDMGARPGHVRLPLLIKTNCQKMADCLAFEMAKKEKQPMEFIALSQSGWKERIASASPSALFYFSDYQMLKKNDKFEFYERIKKHIFIVCTTDGSDELPVHTIELKTESTTFDSTEILTVDEYVKMIVTTFQTRYPDTELSKKLGMSRKSLWEKRKKFGIEKKKQGAVS